MKEKRFSDAVDAYIEPLFEPYLNEIQKALICAYCEWSGEKRQSWNRICSILDDLAVILPNASRESIITTLVEKDWADSPDDVRKLVTAVDRYTKHVRPGSLEHFLATVTAEVIRSPRLDASAQQAFDAFSPRAAITMTAARPRSGVAYCTVGSRDGGNLAVTVSLSSEDLEALQKWIGGVLADLHRYDSVSKSRKRTHGGSG